MRLSLPNILATCLFTTSLAFSAILPYRGVNLAGAEFTPGTLPGTKGSSFFWPTVASSQYFIDKGMNTIRLPFLWERLQPTLSGSFSSEYWTDLKTAVAGMTGKGAYVIIDPHNYARHNGQLIGTGVSNTQFADLWTKLATEFKSNSKVIFAIMNEPHTMSTEAWFSGAQAAINAIRATGATNLILVPGNAWTGAHSWSQTWYGTANSAQALNITDPGNNFAFEVHQYLDSDYSGTNSGCKSTTVGATALQTFTNWLKANNRKGFLGEFAGSNDNTCATAVDGMLDYMESNSDVWMGWTWWAAGPAWGDYMFTLEPNGSDRPQMAWLASHLSGTVVSSSIPVSSSVPLSSSSVLSSSSRLSSSSIAGSSSAANTAPVATADSYTTAEDAPLTVNAPGVLSNDNDANGQAITAYLISQVSHGTLNLSANGSFVYTPNANYSGADAFTYRAYDGMAYGNTVTVSFTVTNVNDAPIGNADSYATPQNTALPISAANGVLQNDTDPEGSTITALLVANPSHGSLTLNADGSFTYTPTSGYTGTDAFGYKPNDGNSNGSTVTVSINVTSGTNSAPTAGNDSYSVNEDATLESFSWNSLLNNDSDPNGDALTSVLVDTPAHGTLQFNADGTFLYVPTANYSGSDQFTYKAYDGSLQSALATVSITVSSQNDNPTVQTPIANQTLEGGFAPFPIDLSAVFVDPDGDNLSISCDGTWMVNSTLSGTTLSLSPANNMSGTQTVTLRASDNNGGQAVSTFELTVSAGGSTTIRTVVTPAKADWRLVVQNSPGVAILRDLFGRKRASLALPANPADLQALAGAQGGKVLLQIGRQTWVIR